MKDPPPKIKTDTCDTSLQNQYICRSSQNLILLVLFICYFVVVRNVRILWLINVKKCNDLQNTGIVLD